MAQRKVAASALATLAVSLAFLTCGGARAADGPVRFFGGSGLAGYNGVIVDGQRYNVLFTDGTCAQAFGGCAGTANFTFKTPDDAQHASQALLDYAFVDSGLDLWDTFPQQTLGCDQVGSSAACAILTPFRIDAAVGRVAVSAAMNLPGPGDHQQAGAGTSFGAIDLGVALESTNAPGSPTAYAWAVWTVAPSVPEPSSLALFSAGAAALCWLRRRHSGTSD